MKVLLQSKAFYHPKNKNAVAKNSVELAVEFIRTLGIPVNLGNTEKVISSEMGMAFN